MEYAFIKAPRRECATATMESSRNSGGKPRSQGTEAGIQMVEAAVDEFTRNNSPVKTLAEDDADI